MIGHSCSSRLVRTFTCLPIAAALMVAGCDSITQPAAAPRADVAPAFAAAISAGQPVVWLSDFTQVDGASSRLVRTPNGVSYAVTTTGLTAGNAYTLWIMIFNNPDGCAAFAPAPGCGEPDIGNPAAQPDMMYAAGGIAGESGKATFAGHRAADDPAGSINAPVGMPAFGLINPSGAEIWLAVHDHGAKIPAFMPDMIQTVAGGCVNAGIGAPVFDDYEGTEFGRRGPNTCRTIQATFHQP